MAFKRFTLRHGIQTLTAPIASNSYPRINEDYPQSIHCKTDEIKTTH